MRLFDDLGPGSDPERAALLAAYRQVDWASTGLGDPSTWTGPLATTLPLLLETRVAAVLFWGPEHRYFCNDVLGRTIGERLPDVLGRPAADVFVESWPTVEALVRAVRERGEATWREDSPVPVQRDGYVEETFFSYSYSPVRDLDGAVVGVLGVSVDTTPQVLARRRLELLNELGECARTSTTVAELRTCAVDLLARHLPDLELDVAVEHRRPGHAPAAPDPAGPLASPIGWWVEPVGLSDRGGTLGRGVVSWRPGADGRVPPTAVPLVGDTGSARRACTFLVGRSDARLEQDVALRRFLQVVADALHAATLRIRSLDGERARAADDRATSLQLQSAMLGPASPEVALTGAQVATRYVPAATREQVGGDWHDAVALPDGSLVVTIGDVAGHDSRAAASMGQLRSLVRGLLLGGGGVSDASGGTPRGPGPARTVELLDTAVHQFALDAVATLVLAEVRPVVEADGQAAYDLRWANAGHPPAALVLPDGSVRLLDEGGELMLGIDPATRRADLTVRMAAGSTLVLYTDGLVERRGEVLDEGLGRLRAVLARHAGADAEETADAVLDELGPFEDDDVAVLVVRLG